MFAEPVLKATGFVAYGLRLALAESLPWASCASPGSSHSPAFSLCSHDSLSPVGKELSSLPWKRTDSLFLFF